MGGFPPCGVCSGAVGHVGMSATVSSDAKVAKRCFSCSVCSSYGVKKEVLTSYLGDPRWWFQIFFVRHDKSVVSNIFLYFHPENWGNDPNLMVRIFSPDGWETTTN